MRVCVLMGCPRKNGNTAAILAPFCKELEKAGAEAETLRLYDREICPCVACRNCQKDWSVFGRVQDDDGQALFETIYACDLLALAASIYVWRCTSPMKALMDRLVYVMNRYYGAEKGPSIWKGKAVAVLETCGDPPKKESGLFEAGVRRFCKHSGLNDPGSHVERHVGYQTGFMDENKAERSRMFASELLNRG